MNIKSLLLGSAAALVAVSGARAADAVVMAEPEPMEYVRICDMYGTGYFYIPGTETCLKFGGYFREEIGAGELFDSPYNSYAILSRAALNFTAKSETEYGTLTGFGSVEFTYTNGGNDIGNVTTTGLTPNTVDFDTGVSLADAYIDLAGFRFGKGDSQFIAFNGGQGVGLGFGGVMDDNRVPRGADTTNFVSYNFDLGGFKGVLSVEEGTGGPGPDAGNVVLVPIGGGISIPVVFPATFGGAENDELNSYVPHVVGGLAYDAGTFLISGVAGYDANNEEFAGKLKVAAKINDSFGVYVMGGYKTDDGDREGDTFSAAGERDNDRTNWFGNWKGGDCGEDINDDGLVDARDRSCGDGYAVWAGFSYVINPMVAVNGNVGYDEGENFAAALDLALTPATGFSIISEVAYSDNFDDNLAAGGADPGFDSNDDAFGGRIRFQRDF